MRKNKINRTLLLLYILPTITFVWHFYNQLEADMRRFDELKKKVVPREVRCRDKICKDDKLPEVPLGDAVLKINNEWYRVPEKYKSDSNGNELAFFWPTMKPFSGPSVRLPEDSRLIQPESFESLITINFYKRKDGNFSSMYEAMLNEEKWGYIVGKEKIHQGLERWRASYKKKFEDWYFITNSKSIHIEENNYPTIVCVDGRRYCYGNFPWKYGIWMSATINKNNAKNWSEIYGEIENISKKIEKIQL